MAELKTTPSGASVDEYIRQIADDTRRQDCMTLVDVMRRASGAEPVMWGSGIVGFGTYHYRYASGREGDWFLVGFASRSRDLTLYIMDGLEGYEELLGRLGRYRLGKSCLYVKRLSDIDITALEELVSASIAHLKRADG